MSAHSKFAPAVATVAAALLLAAAVPAHAAADAAPPLDLMIDGVDSGFVRATTNTIEGKKTIAISAVEPTRPILNAVRTLLDGKSPKRGSSLVLTTGAVTQRASEARLVDVRLPSYAGNANDLLLTYEAASTSTSPSLSLRTISERSKPAGMKLAGFRMSLGDLPVNEATRLDSFALKNKEGAAIPSTFTFDVPSKDAPAFLAWVKKPTAREGAIEYVSSTGELLLNVKVTSCSPASAKIDGPVTHVAVACTRAR